MSDYKQKWVEVLKRQEESGWNVDQHGRAIVVRIPIDEDARALEKRVPDLIAGFGSEIPGQPEWLKFIFYNEKFRFQYILDPSNH